MQIILLLLAVLVISKIVDANNKKTEGVLKKALCIINAVLIVSCALSVIVVVAQYFITENSRANYEIEEFSLNTDICYVDTKLGYHIIEKDGGFGKATYHVPESKVKIPKISKHYPYIKIYYKKGINFKDNAFRNYVSENNVEKIVPDYTWLSIIVGTISLLLLLIINILIMIYRILRGTKRFLTGQNKS